jgi:hypothetical protein
LLRDEGAALRQKGWIFGIQLHTLLSTPLHDAPPEGITITTPHPSQEARMTVTVGQDITRTRTTLTAGGQTVSYYSIPAAEAGM